MRDNADKVALVTGANGGIGRAVARRLLDDGARVVLADLHVDRLPDIFRDSADRVLCMSCDVTDVASSESLVAAAIARFGRIDKVVLNAGIVGPIGPIDTDNISVFDQVSAVNIRGVYIGLALTMAAMKKTGGGAIVVLSSTAGLRGTPGYAPYSASKHAVIGLMKTAALEGAPHAIRVNAVNPGPIDTAMLQSLQDSRNAGKRAEEQVLIQDIIPLRRLGKPSEVADMIAFLCSDNATFCTGQTYVVDGGSMGR